jgi:transposase
MKDVELYAKVRYAVRIEGLSERAAARRFGIDPRTVAKMVAFSVPPGYRRTRPPVRPKLDAVIAIIDGILAQDKGQPKKQRHTAKRIFERLRDEHGFTGGITIVKDYVAGWRQRAQEMFVPLARPGRLRRGDRHHWWCRTQDPFLRVRPAALRRLLCGGLSG